MKQVLLILGMILLIGIVSSYYPGETISVDNTLGSITFDYTISGNLTPINVIFNLTLDKINVTLPKNLAPNQTFIITLTYNEEIQKIDSHHYSGIIKTNVSKKDNITTPVMNYEIPKETIPSIQPNESSNETNKIIEVKKVPWWFSILIIFVIIFLSSLVLLAFKRIIRNRKNRNQTEDIDVDINERRLE